MKGVTQFRPNFTSTSGLTAAMSNLRLRGFIFIGQSSAS
jgi:hypothetical protein